MGYVTIKLVHLSKMERIYTKICKYRIYPTDVQVLFFDKNFVCCWFIWNKMLNEQQCACKKKERIQLIILARYKDEFPFLDQVGSFSFCNTQLQLWGSVQVASKTILYRLAQATTMQVDVVTTQR